ncbi:MAG: GDSL-type esterase/lipase family protein [Eubacteriales bacterium]
MSTPYHRRRKQRRGAALIIVLSAYVMILLLTLFFSAAMKQSRTSPPTDDTLIPKESAPVSSSDTEAEEKRETDEKSGGQNTLPAETTSEQVTEALTSDTEKTPESNDPTKPVSTTPDRIPVTYNAQLLGSVALPEGEMPDGYVDKLVFYGDSTTYGMKVYKVFGSRDTKQVWTPKSGTLALFRAATDLVYDPNTDTELSLNDICAQNKPQILIVTLGVNGVAFMDRDYFKTEYQKVIDIITTASPDTVLILQSIYPVARSYEKQSSINNEKIQAANEWIVELASENQLPYLNTYSALVGEDGYLPEAYQNGDGMHFNEVGFGVVMQYVKSHPYL